MLLTRSLFAATGCLIAGLLVSELAFAQSETAAVGQPPVRFAAAWRVRGDVTVLSVAGQARSLREGDAVFVGERVTAEPSAEAVLKTEDAGIVAVRSGASFSIEKFAAQGRPTDQMTLRVLGGALRVITGWIGRVNRAQHVIITPTASIGVRGTDHEPYVMTTDLAASLMQPEGTYNKVNRGGTTLTAYGRSVDVVPGKVGFARSGNPQRSRALATLLLPVLLDKIPEFYVPGEFDAELDQLSETSEDEAARQFEERSRTPPREVAATGAPAVPNAMAPETSAVRPVAPSDTSTTPASPGANRNSALSVACGADAVARNWLGQLDAAIRARNTAAILAMFAPNAVFSATVRDKDGNATSVDIGRQEFVDSTTTAIQGLTDFRQRRLSVEGQVDAGTSCARVSVKSLVLEQGTQNGKSYRFESVEEYVIERRSGKWLATRATTVLR